MIGYLQGEILENSDGKMLLGVGDRTSSGAGVVGYSVSIPQSSSYMGYVPGTRMELFIHTHVREDALDLYGFSSQKEKALFLTLLTVNGIGPKSALGILSAVEPEQLVEAILQGDQAYLTRIPGIGKRTAERVVVELRDIVKKKVESGVLNYSVQNSAHDRVLNTQRKSVGGNLSPESVIFQDAKSALLSLGYRENEAQQMLSRVLENAETRPQKAEDLIKTALRQLA
jgi:Holliday junction DNA helicase RuvA